MLDNKHLAVNKPCFLLEYEQTKGSVGSSHTASGKTLPTLSITQSQGGTHSYTENERNKCTCVQVQWQDQSTGQQINSLAGEAGTVKTLSKTYTDKNQAITAASAELKCLARGKAQFKMTLAIGNPAIITETPVKISGYKPQIDAQQWVIKHVIHTLSRHHLCARFG